jgi:hypothetical protein
MVLLKHCLIRSSKLSTEEIQINIIQGVGAMYIEEWLLPMQLSGFNVPSCQNAPQRDTDCYLLPTAIDDREA